VRQNRNAVCKFWLRMSTFYVETVIADVKLIHVFLMYQWRISIFPVDRCYSEMSIFFRATETKRGRKKSKLSIPTPVDEIPEELKGSRKWSTVRIPDTVTPSVTSVFLGTVSDVSNSDNINDDTNNSKKY
jgi:hypothetical protein